MTTLSRALGKAMLKSLGSYKSLYDLVSKAADISKPVLTKSHAKFRERLDDSYITLCCDWQAYKEDTGLNDEDFNKVDDTSGEDVIKHNDAWFSEVQENYIVLCDKSDEVMERQVAPADNSEDNKANLEMQSKIQQEKKVGDLLCSQIEAETNSIKAAVDSIDAEVKAVIIGGIGTIKALSLKSNLRDLSDRLNVGLQSMVMQCLTLLDQNEGELKNTLHNQFVTQYRTKIGEITRQIVEKTEVAAEASTASGDKRKGDQTFLKKTDPPKFHGDELLYPDFKRKWIANVGKANLSPEGELDRLRDNVPAQASKMLFGEVTMTGAWSILDKLFGNKTIIANKLKTQLKEIKTTGKEDYDRVINLAIDVKVIEKRLKELKLEQMLKFDDEYLSAVFKALPSAERTEWLKFNKAGYECDWDAMMIFLEDAREKATSTKVLLSSYSTQSEEKQLICRKCGISGHKKLDCTAKINAFKSTKADSDNSSEDGEEEAEKNRKDKDKEWKKRVKERCGKCPVCKKRHTFTRKRDNQEWPSDRLISCAQFQKMSPRERALQLEKISGCSRCTAWGHKKSECRVFNNKCGLDLNGSKCQSDHSRLVCGSGVAYCGNLKVSASSSEMSSDTSSSDSESFPDIDAETLLSFQEIKLVGVQGDQFSCFDGGSNRCLIRHDFARENNLRSQRIKYKLKAVGAQERVEDTEFYMFEVEDNYGMKTKIWAFGIDEIMPAPEPVDLAPVEHLFPHIPEVAFKMKSKKQVQLLIGNNFLSLHPSGGQGRNSAGNLRALNSNFGTGWVLTGAHPLLNTSATDLTCQAVTIARVNKCEIIPVLPATFWQAESMGVLPPKKCGKCLQCSNCSDPGLIHSRQAQEDLEALKKATKLVNGEIHVQYQFKKDPRSLPNNRNAAVRIAEKLEKRLVAAGHLDYYNQELKKYFDRGAAVQLSQEEIDSWQGPVNYISHHGVEQNSVTTPLRIVTNSSLKNGGKSLNDCLISGPNSLNSMFDIATRFRCHESGLVFDLTKAYNSLKTGQVERHVRRFIWRFSQEDPWQDFAFDCVAFGDCPAANFLEIGRDMTANAGRDIDNVAADKIIRDSYVDDGVTGGTKAEVERMKGHRLGDGTYSGTLTQILSRSKLKMKVAVTTGETNEEVKNLIGNKVLGYDWNATTDVMAVRFPVNLTKKKNKKLRSGPDLTVESLASLASLKLSKRLCLGVTNGFLDFLGISCPFTLRFKLLMKEMFEHKEFSLSWDDSLPESVKEPWLELIAEAVKTGSVCFPRTTRPADAKGNPMVCSFSDGAFPAFSAVIYLRWEVECYHQVQGDCDGDFVSSLLCAKAKVTPQTGFTAPRSELSGCVLQSRLALTTTKALQCEESMKPTSVIMMSDSRCSISAVEKSTSALKPFFHNRVSEILENMAEMKKYCPVEDIQHVAGDLNPADLATRGVAKAEDLGPGSYWQLGPKFLSLRRELWPVSREFVIEQLPPEEIRTRPGIVIFALLRSSVSEQSHRLDLFKAVSRILNYSNSIVKVKNILARVVRCWKISKDRKTASIDPTATELVEAEQLLLVSAMVDTATAYQEKKLVSLMPEREGLLIVTRGRLGGECLSAHLGVSSLPILMPKCRAAYLYMNRAHCGEFGTEHKGVVETLARSRTRVWIHRGRDLAKQICRNCPLCIRNNKKLCEQQMAKIRPERLVVCRPWTYICLDFAGPYKVKGVVNSRARMKSWVLVYVCCSTKSVCLLATCGYSTQSFLIRHEEFVARKGAPSNIVSDRGSQLVSAGVVLAAKESPGEWDWSQVCKENSTSNWEFVPIGSQHRNGLSEATVKVLKKSLSHALHPGVILAYHELVTLLARISYSINQRPLGLSNTSQTSLQEDNLMPLTPNMMLLGKNSNESPALDYSEDEKFSSRLSYISTVEDEWWKKWVKEVMPTLLPCSKWKKEKSNLAVGDVVLMWYPGNFKDDYRIAMVVEVHPDCKNLVRTVTVKYRKKDKREPKDVYRSKPLIKEKVAVQRLHFIQSSNMGFEEHSRRD